jgi:predicted AAA+ superfamily ATPase
VLTGSQQFGLLSGISQSLAGRVGVVQLLPFSARELKAANKLSPLLADLLSKGFYPPLYDRAIMQGDWFTGYISTYVERDVRQLINIRDLSLFQRFFKMCAARTGQILNLSSLAADCGITHNTAASWISVLEASYLIYLLRPHHRNFNKRLIKAPKLYFCDVGLAAWLLGIHNSGQVQFHAQRGALFETFVITEVLKCRLNAGLPLNLYYWRDSNGLEIDLILECGDTLTPVEIKSGQTVASDFFDGLKHWAKIANQTGQPSWLVYGGDQTLSQGTITTVPWTDIASSLGR